MLYAVSVQAGDKEFGHGYLAPSCYATYSGSMRIVKTPPPVVSWKTAEDGPRRSQEVRLESAPAWNEDVVFELDGKTVTGKCRRQ